MSSGLLCGPAIIYIGFSLIQIIIDMYKGIYNEAFIKFIIMIIFTLIINILCNMGLTVVAWFLVFIPIIMMTIVSTLLLKVFGTNLNNKNSLNKDFSYNSIVDNSNNISGNNILNQQKKSQFYNNFNSAERINRDNLKKDFYSDITTFYDLSNNLDMSFNTIVDNCNNILTPYIYRVFNTDKIINNNYNSNFINNSQVSSFFTNIFNFIPYSNYNNTNTDINTSKNSYNSYYDDRYENLINNDTSNNSYNYLYNNAFGDYMEDRNDYMKYNPNIN